MSNTGQLAKFNARFNVLDDDDAPAAPATKAPAEEQKPKRR